MEDLFCLRCPDAHLEAIPGSPAIFAECPQCGRHYRVTADRHVVERWLGPLSLVLYPVLFDLQPQDEAARIAEQLYAGTQPHQRGIYSPISTEELQSMLAEIRLELEHPAQSVREILESSAEEADLRDYLARVSQRLGELLGE